jgi:hypothetical protein
VALDQAELAVALVGAAKSVGGGRIAPRFGAVAHCRYFGRGEELKLSHPTIISKAIHDR